MAPKNKKQKAEEKAAELARLAEEQRIEEERREKERQEEEAERAKLLAERVAEEKRLLDELDARLDAENAANSAGYHERSANLAAELEETMAEAEWEHFLRCDELPSVRSEASVNTFLTEWVEAPSQDLWNTLPSCTLATDLMASLLLEAAYSAERGVAAQAEWQRELQQSIFRALLKKLDSATADFLARSDEFWDAASHSCVATISARGCRFGLWVNLAKNPRQKQIDLPELAVTCELPKALALASIAVRVVQYPVDFVSPAGHLAGGGGGGGYIALGGVLAAELLRLPDPAKKVKGWTMRQVTEMSTSVAHQPYPIPGADGVVPTHAPPLRITYVLDEHVIMPESGTQLVGWWDSATSSWSVDGISDVVYTSETRTIAFDTIHLTTLAVLQPTHLELPFLRWLFVPRGGAAGELHLQTQRFAFHFALSRAGCVLRAPVLPQLAELLDRPPMPAPIMLQRLRACGINLCPSDADAAPLERVTPKDAALEAQMLFDLCPLYPRYYLAASRWNQSRGTSKITVRYAPRADDDVYDDEEGSGGGGATADPFAVMSPSWATLEYSKNHVMAIAATDEHETCDCSPLRPETVSHSTPLECLKQEQPELMQSSAPSSTLYQDVVRQMLNSLRVLSFTKAE